MYLMYAALLLHKLGKPINEENLKKVISAAGAEVDEAKIKTLIASLKGIDIAKELENASAIATAPAQVATEQKKEEKKEEKPAESAAGLASLFG